ncbi:DUF86 domain-containing protein [Bdellovibrionota bacterium FG-2]
MQHRDWKLRIEDMLEAISHIHQYTQGFTLEAFCADQKTIDAVVRNFEILGEAAKNVPDDVQNIFFDIPWSKIRGLRNMLAHEYFGINTDIMWKTITTDLAPLIPKLQKMLLTT